jgi:integrase
VGRNVADVIKAPKAKRHEFDTWTESEVVQFLKAAQASPHFAMFNLALATGLRRSELLGLVWGDVDLLGAQLHVNRSLHSLKGGKTVIRECKTDKARRAVALGPSASLMLKAHKDKQAAIFKELKAPFGDDTLVFCQPGGAPWRSNSISQIWAKIARRAGVRPIRLHDARHTHASLMLKQGVSPKVIQERLGHSTITLTLDTYSHLAPGMQEAAAAGFDAAIQRQITNILPTS